MEAFFKAIDLNWPYFYSKTRVWLIVSALLLSLLPLPSLLTTILSILLIGTIGLMHGATDHILFISYRRLKHLKSIPRNFFVVYLGVLLLMGVVWLILPELAISSFILASCYHFGQTQLQYLPASENDWRKKAIYLIWGVLVLAFIVLLNPTETSELLSPFQIDGYLTGVLLNKELIMILGSALFMGLFLWLKNDSELPLKSLVFELLELITICMVAIQGDLLFSFAIFFGLWHSLRASQVQIKKLQKHQPMTAYRFVKESLPFTLLSLFGIAILLLAFNYLKLTIHPFMVVLIAISILTMPHMIIYERFYGFHDEHS